MKTDRELLELAAKAAGITWVRINDIWYDKETVRTHHWNPLTDDGDALRLAVKLNLLVDITSVETEAGNADGYQCEIHNNDPYASTRRAIVRAAAEIGKAMP